MYRLELGFINLMKKLKMLLLQEVLPTRVKSRERLVCVYYIGGRECLHVRRIKRNWTNKEMTRGRKDTWTVIRRLLRCVCP